MEDAARFRPAKRKKFIRQHGPKDEEDTSLPQSEHPPTFVDSEDEPGEPGVSGILKLRRQQRSRIGGVHFSNTKTGSTMKSPEFTTLVPAENSSNHLKAITDRFVGHSGQVVDVNKHMVAYIDSELAKRRTAPHSATDSTSYEGVDDILRSGNRSKTEKPPTRQPASLGLLNEIPLNPNEAQPRSNEPAAPKPRKPRLDRFGRPLPSRKPRKGRTSEDIARDKLVEDIMNESGLHVYQRDENPRGEHIKDSGDADARLASQFQQEYIDAMQSRQAQQKKAIPGADPGQKGPKLGGSRQQRAAMRERELKDEKEKSKNG